MRRILTLFSLFSAVCLAPMASAAQPKIELSCKAFGPVMPEFKYETLYSFSKSVDFSEIEDSPDKNGACYPKRKEIVEHTQDNFFGVSMKAVKCGKDQYISMTLAFDGQYIGQVVWNSDTNKDHYRISLKGREASDKFPNFTPGDLPDNTQLIKTPLGDMKFIYFDCEIKK